MDREAAIADKAPEAGGSKGSGSIDADGAAADIAMSDEESDADETLYDGIAPVGEEPSRKRRRTAAAAPGSYAAL